MRSNIIFSYTSIFFILVILLFTSCSLFDWDNEDDPDPNCPGPYDKEVGELIWTHEIPNADSIWINQTPLAIGQDGNIYYGAGGGTATWVPNRIFSVNAEDGSLRWQSEPLDFNAASSQVLIGEDNSLYVIGEYSLYAIDHTNGRFDWIWEVPQKIGDDYTYAQICGLTLGNDGALYAAHCGPGDHVRKAFCINPDGSMRWAADYNGVKTMVIDKNGELAMARDASWYDWDAGVWHNHYPISCIDAGTGDLIWDREIEGGQSVSVIIAENGDYICQYTIGTVGEMDRIVRLNPSNGDILWSAECWSGTSLLGSSDEIFVRHPNHGIQRINGQDGSLIQSDYGGSVPSIDADGYLHTFRNTSPAIDRLSVVQVDGSLVRETTLDHGGGISPAISKCDIIYLAAGQHIYAIQGEAALEAGQYWPRSTHDNRNTNNSNIDISIK